MNPALPLSDTLSPRRWVAQWYDRLLPLWIDYWPLLTLVTTAVWLLIALEIEPLEKRIAYYQQVAGELKQVERQRDAYNKAQAIPQRNPFVTGLDAGRAGPDYRGNPDLDSRLARLSGRVTGVATRQVLILLLPYLLLLTAIGHYKYWYVTRYTLLAPGRGGKWGYGILLVLLSFILLGVSLTSFGKNSVQIGLSDGFPFLTVGYLVLYSMLVHFGERQREERVLAQDKRQAELDALKAQVNPPFLFHALQGLHQMARNEHLPRTAQSLEQLTGIMQYVLEESRKQTTDIAREIEFIRDYLRLQQLRVPDRDTIRIITDVDWDHKPALIVPLLLNPLIENAFKHGISMQHPCFVTIRFSVVDSLLLFVTENSMLPRNDLEKGTGLGLKNVRRRLELAYPERHRLLVSDRDNTYRVELKVKLD